MKFRSLLLTFSALGLTLFGQPAHAQTPESWISLKTLDGKSFKNAKLHKVEPDGIRISHDDGVAKIHYEKLPQDLRKNFHFSQQQATVFREAQAKKQSEALKIGEAIRRELHIKNAEIARLQSLQYTRLRLEVFKVLPDGLICVPCGGLAAHAERQMQLQASSFSATPLPETLPVQAMWVTKAGYGWAEGDLLDAVLARAGAEQVGDQTLPWFVCKE